MFLQEFSGSSPKRRRAEEKDEGIGSPDTLEEEKVEELRREMLELRQQLDKERSARMQMEEQVRQKQGEKMLDVHLERQCRQGKLFTSPGYEMIFVFEVTNKL